jgi:prevent-host-death family protein
MREREEPITQIMNSSAVRDDWSQVLNQVFRKETRVVVEKSGIPVAAIVSADDLESLKRLEQQRERGFRAMERISRAFADVPVEELERQVDIAVGQAREEKRAQEREHAQPA